MAEYRDGRLEEVCPASVVMELMLVSHAIDIARKEWGICIPKNVVKNINKPTIGRGRDRRLELIDIATIAVLFPERKSLVIAPRDHSG